MATLTVRRDVCADLRYLYTKAKNNTDRALIFGELLQHAQQLENSLQSLRDKKKTPTSDYLEACRIAGVSDRVGGKEAAC